MNTNNMDIIVRKEHGGAMKKLKYSKILFIIIIIIMSNVLIGCNNSKYTEDYKNIEVNSSILAQFPGFTFNNNEGQYYMSGNSAAAENGYYFITQNASDSGTNNFIYFYDMTSQTSVPLCSKLNCQHNDTSCDAYISDEKCFAKMIWYYGGRLYMIERSSEKDILVSYDSEGRNKKEERTLSDANSIVGSQSSGNGAACLSGGYFYYILYNSKKSDNNMMLNRINLSNGKVEGLGTFTMSEKAGIKCYPINGKIYIFTIEYSSSGNIYKILQFNSEDNSFDTAVEFKVAESSGKCRGEIINWCIENAIDNEGNVYYLSWIKGKEINGIGYNGTYIMNQYNPSTKENKELYILEGSETHLVGPDVLSIGGYDGQYIYLYESVMVPDKKAETPLEDSNNIVVMKTDGSIVDKFHLFISKEITDKYYKSYRTSALNIKINIFGGDERYLMISTNRYNIQGMEFSDKLTLSMLNWQKNATAKKLTVSPEVVAVIDKNQIGTGSFTLIKVKE